MGCHQLKNRNIRSILKITFKSYPAILIITGLLIVYRRMDSDEFKPDTDLDDIAIHWILDNGA